jgi:hypothetical protein
VAVRQQRFNSQRKKNRLLWKDFELFFMHIYYCDDLEEPTEVSCFDLNVEPDQLVIYSEDIGNLTKFFGGANHNKLSAEKKGKTNQLTFAFSIIYLFIYLFQKLHN